MPGSIIARRRDPVSLGCNVHVESMGSAWQKPDGSLRFANLGVRSFLAVDLEAREGIGFYCRAISRERTQASLSVNLRRSLLHEYRRCRWRNRTSLALGDKHHQPMPVRKKEIPQGRGR